MQAVLLAAGRGTRMKELTEKTPKSMLVVAGKTLLEHKFDQMPEEVDEIILVVGYLQDVIKQRYGSEYKGKKLTYVTQEVLDGTGGAMRLVQHLLKDQFLVIYADNIYGSTDIARAAQKCWSLVGVETEELGGAANIVVDQNDEVIDIVEKEVHGGGPGLLNAGLYCLDMRFFDYPLVPKDPGSTELGLPQTMMQAKGKVPMHLIRSNFWLEITAPGDLAKAEQALKGSE